MRRSVSRLRQQARDLQQAAGAALAKRAANSLRAVEGDMTRRIPSEYAWLLAAKSDRDESGLEQKLWSRTKDYENLWGSIKPCSKALSSVRNLESKLPAGAWADHVAPIVSKCQDGVQRAETFATGLCIVNILCNKLRVAQKSKPVAQNIMTMVSFMERHSLQGKVPSHLWEELEAGLREHGLRPAVRSGSGSGSGSGSHSQVGGQEHAGALLLD
jgi:hypothetical protein